MITNEDKDITKQIDLTNRLFESFLMQRKLRCDEFVSRWVFDFEIKLKDYPEHQPVEEYVFVNNFHDPGEEFCNTLSQIQENFKQYDIIPITYDYK